MMHNVEDVLEILSGTVPRTVNIRIDRNEKSLLTSLGRQVHKGVALTDRQLGLALTKISKYRDGLIANSVDVDSVLASSPLRMPVREIDRSQKIFFGVDSSSNDRRIYIKYTFSKKLEDIWNTLKASIEGTALFEKNIKSVAVTEKNIYKVVSTYKDHDFEIEQEIEEVYEKIEEILKNPQNYQPHLELDEGQFLIKNASGLILETMLKNFQEVTDANLSDYITALKKYEIFHKNPKISEKIENLGLDTLSTQILNTPNNKFLINSTRHSLNEIVEVVKNLKQWPLLVVLEEKNDVFQQSKDLVNLIAKYIPQEKITIFFRLSKGQPNAEEFNQFVKDNRLNNFIDNETKVVIITKERIPKPLLKADWHPQAALVITNYDYGRIGALLNDIQTVYYYNNSIMVRTNKIGGTIIAEL